MTAITRTKIESNAYTTIFAILNDNSNINDPRDPTGNRAFIFDIDPLHIGQEWKGLPYIVLGLPVVEYTEQSVDGRFKLVFWKHKITVRTSREGSGANRIDAGRTDMLNICDDLQETFNKRTVRDPLAVDNVRKIKLIKISSDVFTIDQNQVYESEFDLGYMSRLQVSD